MELTVGQVAALLKGALQGDPDIKVDMLATLQDAKSNQVSFLSNLKYEHFLYTTDAAAVIVAKDFTPKKEINASLIRVDDPYLSFTTLLEEYQKQIFPQKTGVETPCHRGRDVQVGDNLYQGAFSYIGNNVTIGHNVNIYPHVFIGDNTVIGDHTILYSGVKIYASARIGAYCIIHSGAVLGSDGFGFAPQEDGSYKSIPQLGGVTLGDRVSIGANTVVDCATLFGQSTEIHSGVKLDNLVQVAHNVEIGKNTVIAGQAGISGSTKIGNGCVIAGQAGIIGHLTIANNTTIAAQAGVIKSIRDEGQKIVGSPAFDVKGYMRSYAIFRRLYEMKLRLDEVQKKIEQRDKTTSGV